MYKCHKAYHKEVVKMATYYLAVDMGASSGRHILGHVENGKMILEEVHRFENGMVEKDGELCWEFDRIFNEVNGQGSGKYGRRYLGR